MRFRRGGASGVVTAAIVIVIILGAAGAYVTAMTLNGGNGNSSTSSLATSTHQSTSTVTRSSTSTSAQSSTTSSTGSGTTSTAFCVTSTATASGANDPLNLTAMFTDYSEIAIHFNGTYNGNGADETTDYQVISSTGPEFKVNVTLSTGGDVIRYTDFVLKNGTASAVEYAGSSYTGSYAEGLYVSSISTYYISNLFGEAGLLGELQSGSFVHSTGTTTQKIGPTSVSVTSYQPNTLPLVQDQCGTSSNFSKFSLSTGTVPGKSTILLTSMDIAGSFASDGASNTVDLSLSVTSITTT